MIDDLNRFSGKGNQLAEALARHWEFPLDLLFFTAHGEFIGKLNSIRDFPNAHADVGVGNVDTHLPGGPSHTDIFLARANKILWDLARITSTAP
jgi:hypothetical protein